MRAALQSIDTAQNISSLIFFPAGCPVKQRPNTAETVRRPYERRDSMYFSAVNGILSLKNEMIYPASALTGIFMVPQKQMSSDRTRF